jgi:hypothetical protein
MAEKKDLKFPKGIFAKVIRTQKGDITKISVKKKEFIEYLQSLPDDNEYLNLDVLKRSNPTEKQTHYVVVDDWKPEPKTDAPSTNSKAQEENEFDFAN